MKKNQNFLFIIVFLMISINYGSAQKYFTKTGGIQFFSHTPIEDITAISNTATSVYDASSGKLQWAVLIKSFEFEKALMQEHFNENYMESSSFPKANFKGEIINNKSIDLNNPGTYDLEIQGVLTIHGVSQTIMTTGIFEVHNGKIVGTCEFMVQLEDYDIKIPAVVKDNISKGIKITINAEYELLKK